MRIAFERAPLPRITKSRSPSPSPGFCPFYMPHLKCS
jgi:hypothetical protein